MSKTFSLLALLSFLSYVCAWPTTDTLQPVQGLYIKPSADGTTGDLYVAATEDSGANSQWVAEQPINYLSQQSATPLGYSRDNVITTQKRSIFTSPTLKYAYGVPSAEGQSGAVPYPYATAAKPATGTHAEAAAVPATSYNPYSFFHYFYPYMMSAAAAGTTRALKDFGVSDEIANSVASHAASSMWSAIAPYAYSMQYMSVDPNYWTSQNAAVVSQTAPAAPQPAQTSETETSNTQLPELNIKP